MSGIIIGGGNSGSSNKGDKSGDKKNKIKYSELPSFRSDSVDWKEVGPKFKPGQGVLCEIYGGSNTGRTTLALTAPGPIAYLCFHEKADGLIERVVKQTKKVIRQKLLGGVYIGEGEKVRDQARPDMFEFENHYYDAFKWASSIIIDTHQEAWELERLGEFGAPKPDGGRTDQNYAAINNRWRSILNQARAQVGTKPNVIFIGTVKDEYVEEGGFSKSTGRQVRASGAASQLVYQKCDIVIETSTVGGNLGKLKFQGTIRKGWFNNDRFQDKVYVNNKDMGLMDYIAMITGTEPEEWER